MTKAKARRVALIVLVASWTPIVSSSAQDYGQDSPYPPERDRVYRSLLDFPRLVTGDSITPRWMADGRSFWTVEGAPDRTLVLKHDPTLAEPLPLFDVDRVRVVLESVLGHPPPYTGLPFSDFEFRDEEQVARFDPTPPWWPSASTAAGVYSS